MIRFIFQYNGLIVAFTYCQVNPYVIRCANSHMKNKIINRIKCFFIGHDLKCLYENKILVCSCDRCHKIYKIK